MPERRLNPLAFSAETNGRFIILIVSAIAFTWLVSFTFLPILAVLLGFDVSFGNVAQSLADVVATVGTDVNLLDLPPEALATYYQSLRDPLIAGFWAFLPAVLAPASILLLLLMGAWIGYRLHPAFLKAQHKLVPADDEDEFETAVVQKVSLLALEADVIPAPTVMLPAMPNAVSPPDGQAYGLRGNYQIRLEKASQLAKENPEQFNALVLHEVSHIVNEDIRPTYFASALWVTFSVLLVLMALVLAGVLLLSPGASGVVFRPWALLGRISVTLLIAAAIWRNLLQIREYYADWRTSLWGYGEPLKQMLVQNRPVVWWKRPFHPSPQARIETLADSLRLFRLNWQLPFLTGLLLAIAMIGLPLLVLWLSAPIFGLIEIALLKWAVSLFQSPNPANIVLYTLANVVLKFGPMLLLVVGVLVFIGYLLTKTLGVQVQRETIADMTQGVTLLKSYGRLFLPALWLSIGVQIGLFLIPIGTGIPQSWQTAALMVAWFVVFTIMTWIWLAYVRALTQLMLGVHAGAGEPRRGKQLITALSSILITFFNAPAFLLLVLSWLSDNSLAMPAVASPELTPTQFMTINVIMLIVVAIVAILAAFFSTAVLYLALFVRPTQQCPTCKEQTPHRIALGQQCPYCQQPLARWIYVEPG